MNRYIKLQSCLLRHVYKSISSLDIVDYVAPITSVAEINGYMASILDFYVFIEG